MLRLLEGAEGGVNAAHPLPTRCARHHAGPPQGPKRKEIEGIRPLPRANPVFDKGGRTWQAANSVHAMRATHLAPTFRSSCPVAAPIFHELRKVMGTSKPITPVPLFDLKFLDQIRRLHR